MSQILQLRIELEGTDIWRQVLIEPESSFYDLHQVIQTIMDWDNSHLHEFPLSKNKFIGAKPDTGRFNTRTYLSETKNELAKFLQKPGDKITYVYDFGDSWRHKIKLEEILEPEEEKSYPLCIDGKKQAPPEDCGGVPGYHQILKAIENPDENKELLEWLGGEFNPDKFDLEAVNRRL